MMKLFITYCLVLLFGCVHFSNDSKEKTIPKSDTKGEQVAVDKLTFVNDIEPILEARCQPCHFVGGKMYDRLPFDTVATVYHLKEELFTRIKDENEQQKIKDFLAQQH